jgi:hypothetical protein
MMTGVIERLGVKMVYTTEDPEQRAKMQERYRKKFGEYVPNERFYEIANNQFQHWMDIANTPYSGCKVIIPVAGMRWEAVCARPAKVIMMERNPAEIRQSQEAFYKKARAEYTGKGEGPKMEPWQYAEEFLRTHIAQTKVMLEARKGRSNAARFTDKPEEVPPFDYMVVGYRDVLEDPKKKVGEIARFIQADEDRVDFAVSSVDTSKIRFKAEELDEGI